MDKPAIPTLAQFLGDGTRSETFEEFVEYVGKLMTDYADVVGAERRLVLFMRAFSIAAVEIATREAKGGREDAVEVGNAMLTGGTIAMASAFMSILSPDIPAKLFREHLLATIEPAIDEVIRVNGLK